MPKPRTLAASPRALLGRVAFRRGGPAQDDRRAVVRGEPCRLILCAPELKIEPTWTVENLAGRRENRGDGQVERAARERCSS